MYKGKRIFDIMASFLGIVFLCPIFIIISILIVITSGFPILYRQERVGKNWKMFVLYKFRTMIPRADEQGYVSRGNDRRITAIGSVLRKSKLDELPQLFNVLKGDMSFVGPRPEVKEFAEHYKDRFDAHLSMKPGITDIASIKFRDEAKSMNDTGNPYQYYLKEILPKKMSVSADYSSRATMVYDIKLIIKTLKSLVLRKSNEQYK